MSLAPAEQAPGVSTVYALSGVAGAVALLRLVAPVVPTATSEAAIWGGVVALLLVFSLGLMAVTDASEQRERERTGRERACQVQRKASVVASMLTLGSGYSLLAFGAALLWRVPRVLEAALTVFACFAVLLSVWFCASTVPYAPLPRLPSPRAAT